MKRKRIVVLCGVIVVCGIFIGIIWFSVYSRSQDVTFDPEKTYLVARVLDGDTFDIRVGKKIVTIRMLGIDTPETVDPRRPAECFGTEASAETKRLLSGRFVRLQLSPKREVRDKYGRYLAYTYLDNGLSINEHLIKKGYAREYTYGSAYSLRDEFRKLQKEAVKNKRGLWGACDVS